MSLTDFLKNGYTAYHVTALLETVLLEKGFLKLDEREPFSLVSGKKYFIVREDASLIAFFLPNEAPLGFQIAAAHSDSPALYVTGEKHDGRYVRLSVEKYGGPLSATWYDRPLRLAGRVFVKEGSGARAVLFDAEKPVFLPSVAPHQNREAETKVMSDPHRDLLPLFGMDTGEELLKKTVAERLGVSEDSILSHDLYLTAANEPTLWGDDFISAPRLDDLLCVYGLLEGFLEASPTRAIPIFAVFNGEEIGSTLYEGANSDFLDRTLTRVCEALSLPKAEMLARSFFVSADNAHGIHPSHPELYNAESSCVPNGGVVIKETASRRYTTSGFSAAMTRLLCEEAGVPVQVFRNRPDLPGGGTLGAIATTHTSVPAVDIGLAQLAMHSACETAGMRDVSHLTALAKHYFSVSLTYTDGGAFWQK